MDLDSGFCFTLQVGKSGSEKILSCKILLGRKWRTKIQYLLIFWLLVFQQKLSIHPCTSPYKRSVPVVFLGSSPTRVPGSCQHWGPVSGRGWGGALVEVHAASRQCWSPLGMQKLARPFLHEIREYHLSLKNSRSSAIWRMITLGIYADAWGVMNPDHPRGLGPYQVHLRTV